jgi:hypothetical protein
MPNQKFRLEEIFFVLLSLCNVYLHQHSQWHSIEYSWIYSSSVNNNLIDFVALSVERNVDWGDGEFVFVDGGNWEFVFMDWSNWELVDVDGGNGQVGASGLESGIIGGPGQSEFLAFRRNPVGRSFVGVSVDFLFGFFAVVIDGGDDEFLLLLGFLAGGVVRLGVAIIIQKRI